MTDTPDIAALVKVRKLEWHEVDTFGGTCWDAIGTGRVYRVMKSYRGDYWLTDPDCHRPTLKAAQAAAYADKRARILAEIEPGPGVLALVEALRPFTACVFNDNGDVTIDQGHLTRGDWLKMCAALAALKPRAGT